MLLNVAFSELYLPKFEWNTGIGRSSGSSSFLGPSHP